MTFEELKLRLEEKLAESTKAELGDAPFGLGDWEAGLWHQAREEAFQWVLEMWPAET